MSKRAVLKLDGSFEQGFRATLEVGRERELYSAEAEGLLPADPQLLEHLHQWQHSYRNLSQKTRITLQGIGIQTGALAQVDICRQRAEQVKLSLKAWLRTSSFHEINVCLWEEIGRHDVARIAIQSQDIFLSQLPWHFWDFIEQHPQTDITFSVPKLMRENGKALEPHRLNRTINVLAILGNSKDIDVETDYQLLKTLPNVTITLLTEPQRQQVSEQLWHHSWDILFFAGHGSTKDNKGWISINPQDSLSLDELTYSLRRAIANGLQIAIFNSCHGIGLAEPLSGLSIPHLVVMREPVPDLVAQTFLNYFLDTFSRDQPLHLAVRDARERLHDSLENQFPCASWLPLIYQNSTRPSPTWHSLGTSTGGLRSEPQDRASQSSVATTGKNQDASWFSILTSIPYLLSISLLVMLTVMGVRWLGLLQFLEFKVFDRLIQLRADEAPDPRLLIVEVTRNDIEQLENQYPLHDRTLLRALQTLEQYQPRVIGVDIFREQPTGEGWNTLIDYLKRSEKIVSVCVNPYGNDPYGVAPPSDISSEYTGFADVVIDPDGVVRRHLLAIDPPNPSRCHADYSLSTQLALRYLSAQGTTLEFPSATSWQLGSLKFNILDSSGFYPRARTTRGHQILLNYRSYNSPSDITNQVALTDVLNNRVEPSWVKDKIVLIGVTDPTIKDDFSTPYTIQLRGVVLHAQMVSQLLSAVDDQRPLFRFLPVWGDGVWVVAWAIVGGAIMYHIQRGTYRAIAQGIALVVLGASSTIVLSVVGVVLPVVPAAAALLLTAGLTALVSNPNLPLISSTKRE